MEVILQFHAGQSRAVPVCLPLSQTYLAQQSPL